MGHCNLPHVLRVFLTVGFLVTFIYAFAAQQWVTMDGATAGLWLWCFHQPGDGEDHPSNCTTIAAGDSPAYFEAARGLACVALACSILQLGICAEGMCFDQGKKPAALTFLSCAVALATGVTMQEGSFDQDERWRDRHPEIGVCFTLCIVFFIGMFLMTLFHCWYDNKVRGSKTVSPERQKTNPTSQTVSATTREAMKTDATKALSGGFVRTLQEPAPSTQQRASTGAQRMRQGRTEGTERLATVSDGGRYPFQTIPKSANLPQNSKSGKARTLGSRGKGLRQSLEPKADVLGAGLQPIQSPGNRQQRPEEAQATTLGTRGEGQQQSRDPKVAAVGTGEDATQYHQQRSLEPLALSEDPNEHNSTSIAKDSLYTDNLRSMYASNRDFESARPENVAAGQGEFPLLERIPTYTLPPVRGASAPPGPPPSYNDALTGHYVQMPPPPSVAMAHNPYT